MTAEGVRVVRIGLLRLWVGCLQSGSATSGRAVKPSFGRKFIVPATLRA